VRSRTQPSRAVACPSPLAKTGGMTRGMVVRRSSDRIAPGGMSGWAKGAPKFDVLVTRRRVGSSTAPGRVNTAKSASGSSLPQRMEGVLGHALRV
jgi:hypothetical protein